MAMTLSDQRRLRLPQCLHALGNVGYQACDQLLKFISVFDVREKPKCTCTCKREISVLPESRNENSVVTEEDPLVRQLERVELQNYSNVGSKVEEEKKEHEKYDDKEINLVYPLRPDAVDCPVYIKTGTCPFGQNCRGNHPPRSAFQNFRTPGASKDGDTGKYNCSARRTERERQEINFLGLPIRPLVKECTYYLRNGSCAYGIDCKFTHPNPSQKKEPGSGDSLANGKSVRGDNDLRRNYGNVALQSFGGVSQGTSESSNSPHYSSEMNTYHQSDQTMPQYPEKNPSQIQVEEFPEQPTQRDCTYFMKTGNCKYKSACKYNHPTSQVLKLPQPPVSFKGSHSIPATMLPAQTSQLLDLNSNTRNTETSSFRHPNLQVPNVQFHERAGQPDCDNHVRSSSPHGHPRSRGPISSRCALNEKGLPLRPGVKLCQNYEQQRMCKYGRNCRFNHPYEHSQDVPTVAKLEPVLTKMASSEWGDGWIM